MSKSSNRKWSSYGLSALIAVVVVGWIASGQFGRDQRAAVDGGQEFVGDMALPRVLVRDSVAEPVTRQLRLTGRTAPAREATLAAETTGRVVEVLARRGEPVTTGDLIVRIDLRWRAELLAEADALVKQREIEFKGATQLAQKGFRAESQKAEALAALESARTRLRNVELDIAATEVRAPFDGVLHERFVEVGDFLDIGNPVAVVVEVDPFIVVADVNESDVGRLRQGQMGVAETVDGKSHAGEIRYLAAKADEATRTFRVELHVDNDAGRMTAGMSANLLLPLDEVVAHRLEPSLLSLDASGNLGVKTVDADSRVRFHRVDLADMNADELLISGLQNRVRVITTGQGFVRDGDAVIPVEEQRVAEMPMGGGDQ